MTTYHLDSLWREPITQRRGRASSWDRSGGNQDFWRFEPGERRAILDISGGAGKIARIWFTLNCDDESYLDAVRIRCVFDGQVTVDDVPVGMLTASGPWRVNHLASPVVSVMRSRMMNRDQQGIGKGSFNLLWPMPFGHQARIEVLNNTGAELRQHYYVDYVRGVDEGGTMLFHASHAKRMTTPSILGGRVTDPGLGTTLSSGDAHHANRTNNHVFADIRAHRGRYVGTVLAVESHPDRPGKWYEGDDMLFVDDDAWPPALHGTGTEDYFGMAWGIHRPYQAPDHGVTHYERDITDHDRFYDGRFCLYRWHLADPIPFRQSLHASLETGHGNDCQQRYESVAFWYGAPNR